MKIVVVMISFAFVFQASASMGVPQKETAKETFLKFYKAGQSDRKIDISHGAGTIIVDTRSMMCKARPSDDESEKALSALPDRRFQCRSKSAKEIKQWDQEDKTPKVQHDEPQDADK